MDSLNWLDWINAETFPADEEEDPTDVDFDEDLNLEAVDLEGLLGATRGHYEDEDEEEEGEKEGEKEREGAIATRTRRHVQLEDTAIEELERPLRVGDWDEGGREYRHYIHFLSSLEGEDLMEEDEDDQEFRTRVNVFDRRPETRQFKYQERENMEVEENQELSTPGSSQHGGGGGNRAARPRPLRPILPCPTPDKPSVIQLFPPIVRDSSGRGGEETTASDEVGDFSESQLNELQEQIEIHTQQLLQSLCNLNADRQYGESQAFQLLQDFNMKASGRDTTTTSRVMKGKLVQILPSILLNVDRNLLTLTGSWKPLMNDLKQRNCLNSDFIQKEVDFRALKMRNSMQLFTPAEDTLLARSIRCYGLQFDLIHQYYLPAKTKKQLRFRVCNCLQRRKGNKVEAAILELRKQPLNEFEAKTVREALEKHGFRWNLIQKKHLKNREANFLSSLWDQHLLSHEEDRIFTESLRASKTSDDAAAAAHSNGQAAPQRELQETEENVGNQGFEADQEENHHTMEKKWCQQFDRTILLAVKEYGQSSRAFFSAWQEMGKENSPFSEQEIAQRFAWLSAKFMELAS